MINHKIITNPEIDNLTNFIIIYGTVIMIALVIAVICFFIARYKVKVSEDKLNNLFSKIDHVNNYKNN